MCLRYNYVPSKWHRPTTKPETQAPIDIDGFTTSIPTSFASSSAIRSKRNSENELSFDWIQGKDDWEASHEFIWYFAETILMEIYRREGAIGRRRDGKIKSCQEIGNRFVSCINNSICHNLHLSLIDLLVWLLTKNISIVGSMEVMIPTET